VKKQKSYLHLFSNQRLILLGISLFVVVYWIQPTAQNDLLIWTQVPLLSSEWKMLFSLKAIGTDLQKLTPSADEFYVFYLLTVSIVNFSLWMLACLAILARLEILLHSSNLSVFYRIIILVGILHVAQNMVMCCFIWWEKSIPILLISFQGLLILKYFILTGTIIMMIKQITVNWLHARNTSKNGI
jgi:hypothetical protein